MTTINPETEFASTPKLTTESAITSIEKKDIRGGIIVADLEELAHVLRAYNSGIIEQAKKTSEVQYDGDLAHGEEFADSTRLTRNLLRNAVDFVAHMMPDITSKLESSGKFRERYDYDGECSRFFKSTVEVTKIGHWWMPKPEDKYLLEISPAYMWDSPMPDLAKALGKELALVSSQVRGKLSVVDGWWFNLDFNKVIENMPFEHNRIGDYLAGKLDEEPILWFDHDGEKYSGNVSLTAPTGLKSKTSGSYFFQKRGDNLVGGTWTTWDETGNIKVPPRAVSPEIVFSVSLLGGPAVTKENMASVQAARDYLANLL